MGDKATSALHALMLFNAARLKGRFGSAGELLDLEEQDRDLWDKRLIALGCEWLEQSSGSMLSTYHYEASIAYLHCSASSFQVTNWTLISELYRQMLTMNHNPFVELNYAIALFYSGKKDQAIDILNTLEQNPFLNQYYLLSATFGKIYLLEGEYDKAKPYFERTLVQTTLQIEKDFILKLMSRMKEG
jgi:RNA polymerase sigma-70 factor (ECF subfamily)